MNKPLVFNYRDYEKILEENERIREENERLRKTITNLEIRCRIAEADKNEQ